MSQDDDERVEEGLLALMSRELPRAEQIRIEDLRRVSEGYSRENWIFEGRWIEDGEEVHVPLILRRDPVGSLLETERQTEHEVLQPLSRSGLPVPRALWLDGDGELLGRPSMVMVREQGECDWFVLNSDRPIEDRVQIARSLVSLLAEIHKVDWRGLGLDEVLVDPGSMASVAELDNWASQLEDSRLEAHPELDLVISWLKSRAPTSQATVLVHGDYKPGNALLIGDDVSVMLDWELAHLGDPLEDLGWITNPYRAREHQIPGRWEQEEIVEHYQRVSGFQVARDELLWWQVFSCFKLSTIILNGVSAFVNGKFDVIFQVPTSLYRVMYEIMDTADSERGRR